MIVMFFFSLPVSEPPKLPLSGQKILEQTLILVGGRLLPQLESTVQQGGEKHEKKKPHAKKMTTAPLMLQIKEIRIFFQVCRT